MKKQKKGSENISEEKKNKKQESDWKRYKNLPEDKKHWLAEFRIRKSENKTASQIKFD